MNTPDNLATNLISESQIVHLDIVTAKEKFTKFYANFLSSSWDNQVISVTNFLSLPLSECILNKDLMLLENTSGALLGHKNIHSFVTSNRASFGLEMSWDKWSHIVSAMIKKIEFGINSSSPDDVLLQIDDVSSVLGRLPVSKFEFNLAKDQIIREQVASMKEKHKSDISEMQSRVSSLMLQLDDERKEKLNAIERLNAALQEIESIEESSEKQDLQAYVERSLYDAIVDELAQLKEEHEYLFQDYLGKISKLTSDNSELSQKIDLLESLIKTRNEEISALTSSQIARKGSHSDDKYNEIVALKVQIVSLLKKNVHKQKVINKQKIISKKKTDINQLLRIHNERLKKKQGNNPIKTPAQKAPFWKTNAGFAIIGSLASITFISLLYIAF